MSQIHHELERQQLLRECHALVALIGQNAYANKLLRIARNGLLMVTAYKRRRQETYGKPNSTTTN